jgi:tetratricopeptide (TPR) repeat protein
MHPGRPRWAGFLLAVLAVALSCVQQAQAADLLARFDQANRLYEQGKFAPAAAAYEELARGGKVSAALYFNLGNACFKSGQLGRAIANYRLAERLAPRDPDIRANLQFARNCVVGGAYRPAPGWRRWTSRLTLNEWTVLTAGSLWVGFALLMLGEARPGRSRELRRYVLASGLVGVFCAAGLLLAWRERFLNTVAIVIQREVVMHHGPLEESPSLQTLHDGQELRLIDQKDNWLQLAGGTRGAGWLKRGQVLLLPR